MPIEAYEIIDGQHVPIPTGVASPTDPAAAGDGTDAHGATDQGHAGSGQPSTSPVDTPPAGEGEAPAGTDDDDAPLQDDSELTAQRLERRFARLTALRRKAERERDAERQQYAVEMAQIRGQLEAQTRLLQGAAPALPAPVAPRDPPQAEQYTQHEDYVLAAGRWGAQQEMAARDQQAQAERQQDAQRAFQQQLLAREQEFQAAHPDFGARVRTGLVGKVAPHVQQALMMLPDGPALAYRMAAEPELVARLNTLPPPLVFAELGRLSPPPQAGLSSGTTNGTGPARLPAPLSPLAGAGGGGTPTGAYREDMTAAEYAAWRKRTSHLAAWKAREDP